jgi:hypothetical protein
MERFKKLKDGRIVFITAFNYEFGIAHGFNIGSLSLKYKCIPFENIDQEWQPHSIEISAAYKSVDRSAEYPCTEQYAEVRATRMRHVLDKIFEIELKERHKKIIAA